MQSDCQWLYTSLFLCHHKKVKVGSYIAQYPILRIAQSALHITSLAHLYNQTPSQLLWEASSRMLQLMCEGCSYTYPPLSIARYSFRQLSELEQCRVKKRAQGFNTAAQDLNPGSLSRKSDSLPLSHGASSYTMWLSMPGTKQCTSRVISRQYFVWMV